MNKNPAFLFYSKDWLEGTAELMPDEKGVFIDLLAHQHQKGSLPEDTKRLARIVGLSHNQFMLIWDVIKSKFQNNNNRLVNQKLNQVVNQNISRALKNKINGCLPRIVESFNLNKKQRTEIYKNFRQSIDYDDYSDLKTIKQIKEMVYQSVNQMVNQMEYYIATATATEDILLSNEDKIQYAEFVFLNKDEYLKLVVRHGEFWTKKMIQVLDNYKGAKGKQYKSDYRAILSWVEDKVKSSPEYSAYMTKRRKEEAQKKRNELNSLNIPGTELIGKTPEQRKEITEN